MDSERDALLIPVRGALEKLQHELAYIDMMSGPSDRMRLLICVRQNVKIRMDGNRNHKRPHIHVDYGPEYHTASYAIDTGERLSGNLKKRYDREVRVMIDTTRPNLIKLWNLAQEGRNTDSVLCELKLSLG